MSEPWVVVTNEFVTAERLREIIEEMGMLSDQSPDWQTVAVVPDVIPADAVVTEAVFEGGQLRLKWYRPGAALGKDT